MARQLLQPDFMGGTGVAAAGVARNIPQRELVAQLALALLRLPFDRRIAACNKASPLNWGHARSVLTWPGHTAGTGA